VCACWTYAGQGQASKNTTLHLNALHPPLSCLPVPRTRKVVCKRANDQGCASLLSPPHSALPAWPARPLRCPHKLCLPAETGVGGVVCGVLFCSLAFFSHQRFSSWLSPTNNLIPCMVSVWWEFDRRGGPTMGCSMETRTITSQFRPSMKCCWIVASQAPFGFLVQGHGKPKA
jgi:hypothetical protein